MVNIDNAEENTMNDCKTNIDEHSILDLLTLTRMYVNIPYNAIFEFVAVESSRNLDFFDKNIIDRMYDKFKDERLVMNILLAVRADLLEINIVNADYNS
jgi:hypothetical protein